MAKITKDDCLADLKLRILSTELAPGSVLDEVSLADHYGLSRTPLREVFASARRRGLPELKRQSGRQSCLDGSWHDADIFSHGPDGLCQYRPPRRREPFDYSAG